MMRIEIIAHEALENILLDILVPVPADSHDPEGRTGNPFTMIRNVAGRGMSGSSFGDEVWPESNIKLILFVDDDEEAGIRKNLIDVRRQFPNLGLAVFTVTGYDEWYDGNDD